MDLQWSKIEKKIKGLRGEWVCFLVYFRLKSSKNASILRLEHVLTSSVQRFQSLPAHLHPLETIRHDGSWKWFRRGGGGGRQGKILLLRFVSVFWNCFLHMWGCGGELCIGGRTCILISEQREGSSSTCSALSFFLSWAICFSLAWTSLRVTRSSNCWYRSCFSLLVSYTHLAFLRMKDERPGSPWSLCWLLGAIYMVKYSKGTKKNVFSWDGSSSQWGRSSMPARHRDGEEASQDG